MHTALILAGYAVYFIIVMIYASRTCDVNEYLSNVDYKKEILNRIDMPLLLGLAAAIFLRCML